MLNIDKVGHSDLRKTLLNAMRILSSFWKSNAVLSTVGEQGNKIAQSAQDIESQELETELN